MTPDQYAQKTASDLKAAGQSKSEAVVSQIFERADRALADASFTATEERAFWGTVRAYLGNDVLVEKQSNSALLALMQAIQNRMAGPAKK